MSASLTCEAEGSAFASFVTDAEAQDTYVKYMSDH